VIPASDLSLQYSFAATPIPQSPATGNLLIQPRRDKRAAVRLMCKLLKKQGFAPKRAVTAAARGALPEGRSGHPVIAEAGACSISASVVTNRSTTTKQQYVGLDVSLEQTAVCVVDNAGATIWQAKCRSTPESIYTVVARHAPGAVRIGLETGQLSTWLFHELRARQLPVICIDARHAKAALSLQINKTDANDAHGIAQIVRVGWYREIGVKSMDTHAIQAMLVARAQLVTQKVKLTNCIRGLLKTFGIVLGGGKGHVSRQWCGSRSQRSRCSPPSSSRCWRSC
jgi:hypothetical protein